MQDAAPSHSPPTIRPLPIHVDPDEADENADDETNSDNDEDALFTQLGIDEEQEVNEFRLGEQIKENLRSLLGKMDRWSGKIRELLRYESGHPHLKEAPEAGLQYFRRWETWMRNAEALSNARTMQPTFGGNRVGHVFADT
jgi:hypothetical protein